MDNPVKQSGTLDALNLFGIEFEGLIPFQESAWAIAFRCTTCGHRWSSLRANPDFQKEATECPKAQTSKKHQPKAPKKP